MFGYVEVAGNRGGSSSGGTPGGSDTQVQFNDASAFGGDAGFVYDKTSNVATLAGGVIVVAGSIGTDGVGVLVLGNGTAPTSYPADEAQVYASDISAGNSAMHVAGEGLVAMVAVGGVTVRQKAGTPGTDEVRITHDGTNGFIDCVDGQLRIHVIYNDGARFCRRDSLTQFLEVIPSNGGGESVICGYDSIRLIPGSTGSGSAGSTSIKTVTVFRRRLELTNSNYVSLNYSSFFECALADGVVLLTDGTSSGGWLQQTAARSVIGSSVTNVTTTFANLTGLTLTVKAGRKYTGWVLLFINNGLAADGFKFDLNGGTATMTSVEFGFSSAIGATLGTRTSTAISTPLTLTALADTNDVVIEIPVTFVVNAAGTLIPRQAKNSDAAGATLTTRLGSYIWLEDMP